jgi:hypothetical protein
MEMKARQFGHILGFATAFIVAAGDCQAGENPEWWAVLIGGRLLLLGF